MNELVAVEWENIRVQWVNIGEGWSGDYDEDDPNDENLLRFDVQEWIQPSDVVWPYWETIEDSSYCTRVPESTSRTRLTELATIIMEEVFEDAASNYSIKKKCERLSCLDAEGNLKEVGHK